MRVLQRVEQLHDGKTMGCRGEPVVCCLELFVPQGTPELSSWWGGAKLITGISTRTAWEEFDHLIAESSMSRGSDSIHLHEVAHHDDFDVSQDFQASSSFHPGSTVGSFSAT